MRRRTWLAIELTRNTRREATMDTTHDTLIKPTLLAVDDTADNLALLNDLLSKQYKVKLANSGAKALKIAAAAPPPDLILLDIMMPGMDGYEVCRQLKLQAATRDIPVIFLTACADAEAERAGLEAGAVDYVTKPFNPPVLLARVKTHLALKAQADFLRDKSAFLEAEVDKRTREIRAIQDVTIHTLASLAETRDSETGNHIRRTQFYVKALARRLCENPGLAAILTPRYIEMLFKSAPLHDIGKVGIPDSILLKPGRLSPEEFEIMKTHTTLGRQAIEHAEQLLGMQVDFLSMSKDIAPAAGGRRHPPVGPPDGAGRRLRRPHQPADRQACDVPRAGRRDHRRGPRSTFRPGRRRCLPGHPGRVPGHRPALFRRRSRGRTRVAGRPRQPPFAASARYAISDVRALPLSRPIPPHKLRFFSSARRCAFSGSSCFQRRPHPRPGARLPSRKRFFAIDERR
jgi:putative two-component system response regulator